MCICLRRTFSFTPSDPVFRTFVPSQWIVGILCLLYLRPLYWLRQPHLLILLLAQFTATRLRLACVLSLESGHWGRPVSQPHAASGERFPLPGDVTMKIHCKSLFFHKCLWNSSAFSANLAADWAGWFGIVSSRDHFILRFEPSAFHLIRPLAGRWYVWTLLALCDCAPELSGIWRFAKC